MTLSAEEMAEAVGGPTSPFHPENGELSTLFHWFQRRDRLCVIAKDPSMKAQATDVGFAHALGHLGDRDLIVVFPKAGATAVAQRLPFLDIPSASFVLGDNGIERLKPLRPSDVIASFKGTRGGSHDVSKALSLIEPLMQWLAGEAGFRPTWLLAAACLVVGGTLVLAARRGYRIDLAERPPRAPITTGGGRVRARSSVTSPKEPDPRQRWRGIRKLG